MAPHSSTLAWKIPWMEEPGRLQSMGSQRELDATERLHFHFSLSCIGEGNGNPLQCSCLENPRDGGAWWAAVYGVAQSRTRLKRLSSSSSSLLSVKERSRWLSQGHGSDSKVLSTIDPGRSQAEGRSDVRTEAAGALGVGARGEGRSVRSCRREERISPEQLVL